MNRDGLLEVMEQHLALSPPLVRRHPDDAIRHRGQLGYRKNIIRTFVQFWSVKGLPWPIPAALSLDWVANGSNPERPIRDRQRMFVLRAFLTHVRTLETATEVPDNIFPRHPRRAPHLLSDREVAGLIAAPKQLRSCEPFHGLTLSTLLGLLASTGLRIGEALRLKIDEAHLDADPPHLAINETKFGKSRLVVLHPSVADRLRDYTEQRAAALGQRSAESFFTRRSGQPLRYNVVRSTFLRLLHHAGIETAAGKPKVTLHSFRHRFAVKRLTLWHRAGENVSELLPHLTVYLGHQNPQDTYWYLTATLELLETASTLFEVLPVRGASKP